MTSLVCFCRTVPNQILSSYPDTKERRIDNEEIGKQNYLFICFQGSYEHASSS